MTQLSEITTPGPSPDPGPPIWHKFLAAAAAASESLALVSMHQPPDLYGLPSVPPDAPYLRWSYATFKSAIVRLAAGLQSVGVDEGTPVVSFLPLGTEGALALWAVEALDGVWVPLNARSLANATEITHMIRTALSVAPGKRPLVLVQDAETARRVDRLGLDVLDKATKVVVDGEVGGWDLFSGLLQATEVVNREDSGYKSSFVVFTSGTTSLPKGVHATPLAHFERYLDALGRSPQFAGQPPPRALCAGPANHVPGRYQLVWPLCLGGTAVFAAPAFDLERTAAALVQEHITHVTLVPTMVVALASALAQPLTHLREVRVGSAGVSPAVVRACIDQLGAQRVQVGYGMTEGLYIFSGLRLLDDLIDSDRDEVAVGWPEPGATVKIGHPETGTTLPVGEAGVVHWSGPTAAHAYIGGDTAGVCYQDDRGQPWLNTGDLGRIDDQGRLFLTGRQKDMIIRGGENISPAAMEATLLSDPSLAALRPQVVGAPDEIAGHVPVVIVLGTADDRVKKAIRTLLLDKMGLPYLPDEVVSLADLGLGDAAEYPLTTSGKIQKTELEALVRARRKAALAATHTAETAGDIATVVRQAWAHAIGLDPSQIELDAPVAAFADSITLMRVRAEIHRTLGTAPSMAAILGAESVAALIELAAASSSSSSSAANKTGASSVPKRAGPPEAADIIHIALDADGSQRARTQTAITKALSAYGLAWDDVEDVTPAYDYSTIQRRRAEYETFKFTYGYLVNNKNTDKKTLRRVLEATLAHHRILTSFLVDDAGHDDVLHVLMRQSPAFLDQIIDNDGEIASRKALEALVYTVDSDLASHPGPMARFVLYTLADTGETALLAAINHSVMDGFSVDLFVEDLDQALSRPDAPPQPHRVDYQTWADSYYALRSSHLAQASVAFHAARLADLAAHYAATVAVFPPVPDDVRAQHRAWKPPQPRFHTEHIPLAPFAVLRRRDAAAATIAPSVVVKAAFALYNAHHTAHTHAVFSSLESNRSRFSAFLPDRVSIVDEGADVAGPLYTPVIDLVPIQRTTPVSTFLRRLADDGALLTRYAAAPWHALETALGPEAGPLLPVIVAAQMYNWLGPIGSGQAFAHVTMVGAMVRPKIGLRIMAGEDRERGAVFIFVDGDTYGTLDEFRAVTEEIATFARWLVDEANWDKPIGDIL